MNGHTLPLMLGLVAYLAGGAVPEPFAQQSLSVVVAVLTFAVMDLRREIGRLRDARHEFGNELQYLFGAVDILKESTGAVIPVFKRVKDEARTVGRF